MSVEEGFYRRKLPHWQVSGAPHFLTWLLEGALSAHVTGGRAWIDELLDTAETGPDWLRQPRIADLVVNALRYTEHKLKLYELLACDGKPRPRSCLSARGTGYELERIIRYVERNPVKAGLVKCEEDWPWSSAFPVAQASGLLEGKSETRPT